MTTQAENSHDALLATLWQLAGRFPDRGDCDLRRPWASVVQRALQNALFALGPRFDPWQGPEAIGPRSESWIEPPQPLPPRALVYAAIAQEAADRALIMQETADALKDRGERRSAAVIADYISSFVDDICDYDFRIPWLFPPPRPYWLPEEISGIDLAVAGVQFQKIASGTGNNELKQIFAEAGARLAEEGLARLQ
jgi:hypothetical protein